MKNLIPWMSKGEEEMFSRHPETALTSLACCAGEFPCLEVSETDNEYSVKVELPGMDEKDIEVNIEGRELMILGERKREPDVAHRDYYVSEVCYGEFCRSIDLPEGVDRDNVKAVFRKGELMVTLPKTAECRAFRKRIDVMAA
jgi:HSP20 family protein